MPSKKTATSRISKTRHKASSGKNRSSASSRSGSRASKSVRHLAFFPIVFLVLLLWVLYRNLFAFPVWFDESIGKAIFFGLPVWAYVIIANAKMIPHSFAFSKMRRGLMMGIAVGGIFGFIASLLGIVQHGGAVKPALLFTADAFWWEFFLAMLTSFWETLFFYSFVMLVINQKFAHWDLLKRILLVSAIFTIFHLPNTVLRFDGMAIAYQVFLLSLFSIGQALLFESENNAYALVLSQAIWGMVLLVHF